MSSAHGADWAEWEFASSPIIYRDRVIVQADVKENSFLAALDLYTGEIRWKKGRNDWPGWSSPNIYFHQGVARIAVNGYRHRGGYDFETGEEVWKMDGGGDVPVPTPVLYNDLIYFNSAHGRQNPILAVHNSATGKIRYPDSGREEEAVAWFKERGGSYMQTLLVYNGLLYNLRWNGNLTCFDAQTGEEIYRETVDTDSFIASPVAADGKIYTVSEEGDVFILEAGSSYNRIASIPLGEITLATPAITDGMIIFRTTGHLIGISKTGS
jgi:outer membrane protein assembly factor BamB